MVHAQQTAMSGHIEGLPDRFLSPVPSDRIKRCRGSNFTLVATCTNDAENSYPQKQSAALTKYRFDSAFPTTSIKFRDATN